MLHALSPLDGRYEGKTKVLQKYFSEFALIRYRIYVEVEYFKALAAIPLPQLKPLEDKDLTVLDVIYQDFSTADAEKVKDTEKITNHDVKAVEYFVKEKFEALGFGEYKEFIHFALTSQDINNTAIPVSFKEALNNEIFPEFENLLQLIKTQAEKWTGIPMLAHTHGQPASPTSLGKEWMVFFERLENQYIPLEKKQHKGKFGGATGNFNAHLVTYPDINWQLFADRFLFVQLGIHRHTFTTQISHYDRLAEFLHAFIRINTILIDMCRDIWTYIQMDYFKQKVKENEVGSSAMPHKVNPIDFENAEGNLGLANAILEHLAKKLPVSRLQRDLTDSTVLRNIGVPFGHILVALKSIDKGLNKLVLNQDKLNADLEKNWAVVAEAIQNILRREGIEKPYEKLKAFTRGKGALEKKDIAEFIDGLDVTDKIKMELHHISPHNYIGYTVSTNPKIETVRY